MKKTLIITLTALVILGIILFSVNKNQDSVADDPVIKIGISLPLTGPLADMGQANKTAIDMVYAKWQEKGMKNNYEFLVEDNQKD